MKKYIVFIASFAVLYVLFQISSGFILTLLYKPEMSLVNSASQEIAFGKKDTTPLFTFGIFLTGTIAYFITEKLLKKSASQ